MLASRLNESLTRPSPEIPAPRLDHLRHLTGAHGIFEHALYLAPRLSHGYTTDDNARVLVVLANGFANEAARTGYDPYLRFVLNARTSAGFRNRMSHRGVWADRRGTDDCHGRAIWGLGTVLGAGFEDERVISALRNGLWFASPHLRAKAYAILGATAAAKTPGVRSRVEEFLLRTVPTLPQLGSGDWRWPEKRMTYDNARVPEAMIRAARTMDDGALLQRGLDLLAWLIEVERGNRAFSFTPVSGRTVSGRSENFDQQPIEAWAMADACFAASEVDDDPLWASGLVDAVNWFFGANDAASMVYDAGSGAGFDGLVPDGVNRNRGAESTLSAVGAIVAFRRWKAVPGP